MRTREIGKICDGLWYLGRLESCVYWVEGNHAAMIISGGLSYAAPDVIAQIKEFGLPEEKLKGILILHAHFDHIGIIPLLKKTYPQMTVYGSERAWEILTSPKAIETINLFSRIAAERVGTLHELERDDLDWDLGDAGAVVRDGESIDLGGMEVQVLYTPGHSSCSVSAYVPQLKALFPSDGGGIPYEDIIVSAGNSDYTKYQASLERLAQLDVRYMCADHFGYVQGEEAAGYIRVSATAAQAERERLEDCYRIERDIDKAAKRYTDLFFEENPQYFLAPEIYLGVSRQMVRHIAKFLDS